MQFTGISTPTQTSRTRRDELEWTNPETKNELQFGETHCDRIATIAQKTNLHCE